ncbi:hypothetical protein HDV06_002759 [Boothiomyces sp. JEL0866]|nr:hypothetical protein HDV06_002759 [Boothiomyces sp. JEL0866]
MSSLAIFIGQIWLVLSNLLFLSLAILATVIGVEVIKINTSNSDSDYIHFNLVYVAYFLFTFAGLFTISAISGSLVAIYRKVTGILWFYIISIVVDVLLISAGGIYALIKLSNSLNTWKSFSLFDWQKLNPQVQNYIQVKMYCCGFNRGDNSAYTGKTGYLNPDGTELVNVCAITSITNGGCHEAGISYFQYFLYTTAAATIFAFVIGVSSIVSAYLLYQKRTARQAFIHKGKGPYQPIKSP